MGPPGSKASFSLRANKSVVSNLCFAAVLSECVAFVANREKKNISNANMLLITCLSFLPHDF